MPRGPLVLAALTASLAIPASAGAAVKSGVDRHSGVRLTLNGRVLTATIVKARAKSRLFGRRIDAICSPLLQPAPGDAVIRRRSWPDGAERLRFRFARDVSRDAKWCLLEHRSRDVAAVSFIRPEPVRFVAKGTGPSGDWWRLAGWRGIVATPCALLRLAEERLRMCFTEMVDGRTSLGVREFSCGGDVFAFGFAGREWSRVRAVLPGGVFADATLFDPPAGSRVRGHYFVVSLPAGSDIRAVDAVAANNDLLRRPLPDAATCGG